MDWVLALAFLVIVLSEAVSFHRNMVCRQRAWGMGLEGLTRTLLSGRSQVEKKYDRACVLLVMTKGHKVVWQMGEQRKGHLFQLMVWGKL